MDLMEFKLDFFCYVPASAPPKHEASAACKPFYQLKLVVHYSARPSRHSDRAAALTPVTPASPDGLGGFRKLLLHVQPLRRE